MEVIALVNCGNSVGDDLESQPLQMGLLKTALQLSLASGRSLSGRCSSVSAVFILTNHKEKQVGARQAPLSFRVCHPSDDPSVVFASQEI